jgi:DNA-directed RNA polymerase
MKDPVIGKLTGVIPSDIPEDLYQYVADVTTDHCDRLKKENAWYETFLNHWKNKILRKVTKRSTMCEPYGLTFYGIQRYIKEEGHLDWVEPEKKGGAIVELARAIKSSLDSTLQEPNKGKAFLKSVTEKANELNKHLIWTTPSGFKVVHYYNKQQKRRSLSSLFNRKELIFYVRTDDVNPREALQAISPNFIHSLDAAHMFLTIKDLIEQGIYSLSMVHDSYGCRPNDVTIMQNNIRKTFVDIHKHNQLEVFKRQIEYQLGVKLPDVPDEGSMDIADVMQSKYFFA